MVLNVVMRTVWAGVGADQGFALIAVNKFSQKFYFNIQIFVLIQDRFCLIFVKVCSNTAVILA